VDTEEERMESFMDADVARYWDTNAPTWIEDVRAGADVYRQFLNNPAFFEMLGPVKGLKVLDAGCGEGYNTRKLAELGATVVGIDVSKEMIKAARQTEDEHPLGIRYEVTSFSDLSIFEDESFERVVSFMALMDGPDYPAAIWELSRVLKRNGILQFSITHPCFNTVGYGWGTDECGNVTYLKVDGYFEKRPYLERWRFSRGREDTPPFVIPRFPRTLSDYLNPLWENGLAITWIGEPYPSDEACQVAPSFHRWRRAAIFLHVRARKLHPAA